MCLHIRLCVLACSFVRSFVCLRSFACLLECLLTLLHDCLLGCFLAWLFLYQCFSKCFTFCSSAVVPFYHNKASELRGHPPESDRCFWFLLLPSFFLFFTIFPPVFSVDMLIFLSRSQNRRWRS